MLIRKSILILILFVLFIIPESVSAWDSERHGFIMGIGFGFGHTSISGKIDNLEDKINRGSFCGDFKIGYAPSNQFMIYYTNKMAVIGEVYKDTTEKNVIEDLARIIFAPVTLPFRVSHMEIGIGMTYYFNPKAPSFYINGGYGVTTFPTPLIEEVKGGPGFFAGAGYEFNDHYSAGVEIITGGGGDSSGGFYGFGGVSYSWHATTVMFKLNMLGY